MSGQYERLIGLPAVGLAPAAFSSISQAADQERGTPWWIWLLLIPVLFLVVFCWWWLQRSLGKAIPTAKPEPTVKPYAPEKPAPVAEVPVPEKPALAAAVHVPEKPVADVPVLEKPAPVAKPAPPVPDDLAIVEGIGPKIASLFQAAGITTFAQLAATDVDRLRQILRGAGIRIADPTTWPEQAALAAAGEWDKLKALQDQLKGGRRV
jgi:predicted flap endonuclease-1-like 5' DNA nuclease